MNISEFPVLKNGHEKTFCRANTKKQWLHIFHFSVSAASQQRQKYFTITVAYLKRQ